LTDGHKLDIRNKIDGGGGTDYHEKDHLTPRQLQRNKKNKNKIPDANNHDMYSHAREKTQAVAVVFAGPMLGPRGGSPYQDR
jgi:hypothetical protein